MSPTTRNLGWTAVTVAAMVALGGGLMAMLLPFRVEQGGHNGVARIELRCGTPLASAFDDIPEETGGWFAYAPNTGTIVADETFCATRARARVSWGGATAGAGALVALRQRRHASGSDSNDTNGV